MKVWPEKVDNWQVTDWLDYEGEALFDYINGGAELYLSYGLVGMTGCKYNGEGLPQVTVEIYEMTSSANAFGIYTQSRDKEEYEYGQGSQSAKDFILFWKDKYYVIITTEKVMPESEKAIRHIASLIDKAIPGTGRIPAIVDALPKIDLAPGGYLYFHHYVWLNAYLFIANYNIINISDKTDAVLAKYGSVDDRGVKRNPIFQQATALINTRPMRTHLRIIEAKRREYFKEDRPLNPPAKHIAIADTRYHLGTSDPSKIELIKLGWDENNFV
jgi:hypothetical protein